TKSRRQRLDHHRAQPKASNVGSNCGFEVFVCLRSAVFGAVLVIDVCVCVCLHLCVCVCVCVMCVVGVCCGVRICGGVCVCVCAHLCVCVHVCMPALLCCSCLTVFV